MRSPDRASAPIEVCVLPGPCGYDSVFRLQRAIHAARLRGELSDVLLLLEHRPVVTHSFTGRGSEFLLVSQDRLAERGVELAHTDRGGSITFHGPGQLVGYPIVALEGPERDLHAHLRRIEAGILGVLAGYGLRGQPVPGRTGVWTEDGERKIAAIGVKAASWVTTHGFACNVDVDLRWFELIVACGLSGWGVTNLHDELARAGRADRPTVAEVTALCRETMAAALNRTPSPPSDHLRTLLDRWAADLLPPVTGLDPGPIRGPHDDRHPPPAPR